MPDEIEVEMEQACSVTHSYAAPEGDARIVGVMFTDGVVTHNRSVNAVFTDGAYDADATEERVCEVARGVENKIACGAISEAAEEPGPAEDEPAPEPDEAA